MNNKINELEKELIKIKYEKEIMLITHDNEIKKKRVRRVHCGEAALLLEMFNINKK